MDASANQRLRCFFFSFPLLLPSKQVRFLQRDDVQGIFEVDAALKCCRSREPFKPQLDLLSHDSARAHGCDMQPGKDEAVFSNRFYPAFTAAHMWKRGCLWGVGRWWGMLLGELFLTLGDGNHVAWGAGHSEGVQDARG